MDRVDVTAVIVNWNTADLLEGCLENLRDHGPTGRSMEVVVVDNDSADDSVERVRSGWPDVTVIEMGENAGFCRANNAAIRATDSEHLLLINTDGRLTEGALDRMLAYLDADPLAAVVGPRLEYGDGTFQRWTGGELLTLRSLANYMFFLDKLSDRRPALRSVYAAHDTDEPYTCGWVSSAVMLLRRAALDDIGLLDERIFLYMDDIDLCQRAVEGGWHVWYAADAHAVHYMSGTSKKVSGGVSPETIRSAIRWYARRNPKGATAAFQAIAASGFGVRAGLYGVRALVGDQKDEAARMAGAHLKMSRLCLERPDV